MNRATWDETWMSVADAVSKRSPCVRMQAGAVIVDAQNRIVATGYNGFPAKRRSNPIMCDAGASLVVVRHPELRMGEPCARAIDGPKDVGSYSDCFSIHCEANALLFCDRRDREDGTIYITSNMCWDCAKLVANSGLVRVVMRVDRDYRPVTPVLELMAQCSIDVMTWES